MITLLGEQLRILLSNLEEIKTKLNSTTLVESCKSIIIKLNAILKNKDIIVLDDVIRYQDFFVNNESAKYNVEEFYKYSNDVNSTNNFIIYCITECMKEINTITSVGEWNIEEMEYLLNVCDEYTNINNYMDYLLKYINYLDTQKDLQLPFLGNKYKIFFAGHSNDDIKTLPKPILIQFIKKIDSPLSKETIIPLAEGIDHVNELYGTSFFRIQFADDYRIAYERVDDCTIILGVTLKNGKNLDYTRYDSVAVKNEQIISDCKKYIKGIEDINQTNLLEFLQDKYLVYLREKNPENAEIYQIKPFSYLEDDDSNPKNISKIIK